MDLAGVLGSRQPEGQQRMVPSLGEPSEKVHEPAHPGRWFAALLCVSLIAGLVHAFATTPNIRWEEVRHYLTDETILNGLRLTVVLAVVAQAVGIAMGAVLAIMRISPNPLLNVVSGLYIFVFRGVPALVQIIFWYNLALVFPRIGIEIPGTDIGISAETNQVLSAVVSAIIALGLNEAAYMAEIVRAGIESVDEGQVEASTALGLTRVQRLRRVILPQAMRAIVPPTGNEFIGMLKSTSLVSVIAAQELLTASQIIYSRNFLTIELLIVASIWYLAVTSVAMVGQSILERRMRRGDRKSAKSGLQMMMSQLLEGIAR